MINFPLFPGRNLLLQVSNMDISFFPFLFFPLFLFPSLFPKYRNYLLQ